MLLRREYLVRQSTAVTCHTKTQLALDDTISASREGQGRIPDSPMNPIQSQQYSYRSRHEQHLLSNMVGRTTAFCPGRTLVTPFPSSSTTPPEFTPQRDGARVSCNRLRLARGQNRARKYSCTVHLMSSQYVCWRIGSTFYPTLMLSFR